MRLGALRNAKKYIIEARRRDRNYRTARRRRAEDHPPSWPSRGPTPRRSSPSRTVSTWPPKSWRRWPHISGIPAKQLTAEELAAEVKAVIAEVGATSTRRWAR